MIAQGAVMADDLADFRQRLLAFAKVAVTRAEKIDSEAATNLQLVQPFLALLSYDVTNPDEVRPEHHADFSEKYQNKVDYAILRDGHPVIAFESKKVNAPMKDDRGQLKSYFNASPTITLGVLTDGLRYEFYADSDKPNMMDDTAFLKINFTEMDAVGTIEENLLRAVAAIRKDRFNPENVGAEAKRKLLIESIVRTLKTFKEAPSNEFVHFLLSHGDTGNLMGLKVTKKVIEKHRQDVREAVETFVAQEVLARFDYAPKDVVKATIDRPEPQIPKRAAAAPVKPGEMPPKPVITSAANKSYQAGIDKLAELAGAGDWAGVQAYEVKGQNTYAKVVLRYRDALVAAHRGVPQPTDDAEAEDKVAPSEQELAVFTHARERLYFLVRSEALFDEVKKVQFRKSSGTFRVYYERPTAGALFNFREGKEHKYALRFPPLDGKEIAIDSLNDADEPLLQAFTQRVRERGIPFETPPVLRTIAGGQVAKP
jgi:hypothetical protein